jgi:hypothetical protein
MCRSGALDEQPRHFRVVGEVIMIGRSTRGVVIVLLASVSLVACAAVAQAASGEVGSSAAVLRPTACDGALQNIPKETRALVLLDARLYQLMATDVLAYARAAAARRKFGIAVVPIVGLDDRRPEELRRAIRDWRAARPGLEGILFVGNVKLPSFFMPRPDTPSTRLWSRYYEDLTMVAELRIAPGTILKEAQLGRPGPYVAGLKEFKVPEHDFDELAFGSSRGPELWAAFLPVGYPDDTRNTYEGEAGQLAPFFRKALAFYDGRMSYGHGLYLVSNDLSCLARSRPVWKAVGPREIEYYAINEKGPGAFKNNPAGYVRADLTKYASADAFLAYAGRLPWMDEGWQSADVFLAHMRQSRRRFVWWNVHSNPGLSLVTSRQAHDMENGGLIALLNGCAVCGFRQPGSHSSVDVRTTPADNVLVNVVYGRSSFLAGLGCPHNRVNDEGAAPLFEHMYAGRYLGMAHLLRLRRQDRDSPDAATLRGRHEMLIGDPFLDTR